MLGRERLCTTELLLIVVATVLSCLGANMLALSAASGILKTDTSSDAIIQSTINQRLANSYLSTIQSLVIAIDAKDSYTKAHTTRVQEMSAIIARQMGMSDDEVEGVSTAALVHDIGKIGIPVQILQKPGKLTREEFKTVQEHSIIGSQILEPVDFPWPIAATVRGHHEKWDGTGYPDGLKGQDIPIGARVLAVADVFDALTSNRSYRDRLTVGAAITHINKLAGSHFDPKVVEAFADAASDMFEQGQLPVDDHPDKVTQQDESEERRSHSNLLGMNHEIQALSEMAHALSSALHPHEMVSVVAEKIRAALEADACVILLNEDADSSKLTACGVSGVNNRFFTGAYAHMGEGVTGTVAETSRPHLGHYQKSDLVLTASTMQWEELRSCMIAPITRGGSPLGCINVYLRSANGFNKDDLSLLMLMASRTAAAIERASTRMRAEQSSGVDALTGLMNAKSLSDSLQEILYEKSRQQVSVLYISIDNYQSIGMIAGKQTRNQVIQSIGRMIRASIDESNLVARYSSDTFVAALIGSDGEKAKIIAGQIESQFASFNSSGYMPQGAHVEICIGVATCPEDGTTAKSLLTAAERDQRKAWGMKKQSEQEAA